MQDALHPVLIQYNGMIGVIAVVVLLGRFLSRNASIWRRICRTSEAADIDRYVVKLNDASISHTWNVGALAKR